MSKSLRVLLIEDSEDDAELLVIELERGGYDLICQRVDTAEGLRQALQTQDWDIALADYKMPHFNAIAALNILKEFSLDLPFIIVSGSIGEEIAVSAMKSGAHDYLMKGNLTRLLPAVERELREAQNRSERRKAAKALEYLAFNDVLTGLPNLTAFLKVLEQTLHPPDETPANFAVFYIDIDRYQTIKYSLGHSLSEKLLVNVAQRLRQQLSQDVTLARIASDEFVVLMPGVTAPQHAEAIATQIRAYLSGPIDLEGSTLFSTCSIGIVLSTIGFTHPEEFLRAADTAKFHARKQGNGSIALFRPEMQIRAVEQLALENDLQRAIADQRLHLNYQPIISLKSGDLLAFEALVRWQHPQLGLISPCQFIPLAEETGLINDLGAWVLRCACQQLKTWRQRLEPYHSLNLSINLSARQLMQPDLVCQIDQICEKCEVEASSLHLEITESALMENASVASLLLSQLKDRQIRICIDDFGTGYSSLSYLTTLPIDVLKIDRSFIKNMETDPKNLDVVKAIVSLAHSLELEIVAEGVETSAQLSLLQGMGCEYGQGYLFSAPLEVQGVSRVLQKPWHGFFESVSADEPKG